MFPLLLCALTLIIHGQNIHTLRVEVKFRTLSITQDNLTLAYPFTSRVHLAQVLYMGLEMFLFCFESGTGEIKKCYTVESHRN